jgi:hypothetical protein
MGTMHDLCAVQRHTLIRRLRLVSGEVEDEWWETRPCGTPLFSQDERTIGVCRSCAGGWESDGNHPPTACGNYDCPK